MIPCTIPSRVTHVCSAPDQGAKWPQALFQQSTLRIRHFHRCLPPENQMPHLTPIPHFPFMTEIPVVTFDAAFTYRYNHLPVGQYIRIRLSSG